MAELAMLMVDGMKGTVSIASDHYGFQKLALNLTESSAATSRHQELVCIRPFKHMNGYSVKEKNSHRELYNGHAQWYVRTWPRYKLHYICSKLHFSHRNKKTDMYHEQSDPGQQRVFESWKEKTWFNYGRSERKEESFQNLVFEETFHSP